MPTPESASHPAERPVTIRQNDVDLQDTLIVATPRTIGNFVSLQRLFYRIQLLADELIATVQSAARDQTSSRESDCAPTVLEQRVMLSASPVPVDVQMDADPSLSSDGPPDASLTLAPIADDNLFVNDVERQDDSLVPESEIRRLDLSQPIEVVFVDGGVDDSDTLLGGLRADSSNTQWLVVELSSSEDGITQVTNALSQLSSVDAVHIVSHGNGEGFQLGSVWLDLESTEGYAGEIASWANSLDADADLLIYGCDLASTADGQTLIASISALCDCDVAASDDATGHESLGADWDLEYNVGAVTTDTAFGDEIIGAWYGTLDITTGLVGHWELDDGSGTTAIDSTANNNDGTVNGTATWISGEIGGAFEFNYGDGEDYIEIPNSATLENVQEGDYTLAAWFRPDSTPPGSGSDNDANYGVLIKAGWHNGIYFNSDNRFIFDHQFSDSTSLTLSSGNTFATGQFHHIVAVLDRTAGTAQLYVNGQLEDSGTFTANKAAREYGTETWKLGIAIPSTSNWGWAADGAIDDARIFSRALTSSDVGELAGNPTQTITFQQGDANGYSSTLDTDLYEPNPNTSLGSNATIGVDDYGGGSEAQALIRFDDIFGAGVSQIPDGAIITSASLSLTTTNTSSGTFYLHKMLSTWDESSTWNSMSGGLSADGVEMETVVDAQVSSPSGTVVFNGLESTVQEWRNGDANYGWGITTDSTDAWIFASSENGSNPEPLLSVTYVLPGTQTSANHSLVVDTANDVRDGDVSSIDALLANKGADGFISLREAILAANATVNDGSNPDQISFAIGSGAQTIMVGAGGLPTITDALVLDATTQTGYAGTPLITLDGSNATGATAGINLRANDSTIGGFIVQNFPDEGIEIDGSTGFGDNNVIENNWVGITAAGGSAGNADDGILVTVNADNNEIRNNVVVNSGGDGIEIRDNSTGNWVWSNTVGLAADGVTVHANTGSGVVISVAATGNTIGSDGDGTNDAAERNIISGNTLAGVYITDAGTDNNTVAGNYIGTDSTGLLDRGNTIYGIHLGVDAANNVIGGTAIGQRNVISGNDSDGIRLIASSASSTVIGNFIGTDVTGTADLGNSEYGIRLNNGAAGTVIGGITAAERNVISGNDWGGIDFSGGGANNITVQGNFIGTDVTGTAALGNSIDGVQLRNGASNNLIGGTGAGEGNLIAYNNKGVTVWDGSFTTIDNAILGNSIHSNGFRGIDLADDGVSANDLDDGDSGHNDLLNFPVLTNVVQDGSDLDIYFDVDLPAGNYRIEFFDNPNGLSDTGFGEGETFIGFANITVTGATAYESFSTTLTGVTASSVLNITTTATEADGTFTSFSSTSEFGPQFLGAGVIEVTTTADNNDAGLVNANLDHTIAWLLGNRGADGKISLREAIIAANNTANIGGNPDEIRFEITAALDGDGAHTIDIGNATDGGLGELPTIWDAVIIDGTTDSDFSTTPMIQLNGTDANGPGDAGLTFSVGSDGSTVRGLVINRFGQSGLDIVADNMTIAGNYIGVGVDGVTDLGNTLHGIYLFSANSTIGGTSAVDRNVISGNETDGILIVGVGSDSNTVIGNYIGVDVTGTVDVGNTGNGIQVRTQNNVIGGDTIAERNVISGNDTYGILLSSAGATGNVIEGNLIGTNATGNAAIGNGHGVRIEFSAFNNTIGGLTAGQRNVISGNGVGVSIAADAGAGNTIIGNYIGLDVAGTAIIANGSDGISVVSDGQTIGGNVSGAGNVISGNAAYGVRINSSNNTVAGNLIGTDHTGTVDLGNGGYGININDGSNNTIGGTTVAERNVISGNAWVGIDIIGTGTGNVVIGNYVGSDITGTLDLGNTLGGVSVRANDNRVGGVNAGESNLIYGNDSYGVLVSSGATGVAILGNSIRGNTNLGIDLTLNGVTYNDSSDGDSGDNNLLNFPVLTNVFQNGANLDIDFDVDLPAGNYRIEFFDNPSGLDGSRFGEGETFIGFANITVTGAAGYESFSTTLTSVTSSDVANITTTATEADGTFTTFSSTSEFGPQFLGAGVLEVTTTSDNNDAGLVNGNSDHTIAWLLGNRGTDGKISLREAIIAANNTTNLAGNPDEIRFEISDALVGGVHTISLGSLLPAVTDAVIIDGSSDGDYIVGTPVIEIDGNSLTGHGIDLLGTSDGSTIRGLIINEFDYAGIHLYQSDGNTIVGNWLGTDADGLTSAANGRFGIEIDRSASNQIGGSTLANRNVISGNTLEGISIWNSLSTLNVIQGNYIGVDKTGDAALGNGADGIVIGGGANNNTIGGDRTAGESNVISGQIGATSDGIEIDNAGADNNKIYGNYIGTNHDGTAMIGNARYGVVIYNGVQGTEIGGTGTGQGNIISGNLDAGIMIDGNSVATTSGNVIVANYIGTDVTGMVDLGNVTDGIVIKNGAQGNTIGGSTIAHRNLISGNNNDGIWITGSNTDNNTVQGNWIGLDAAGGALGNSYHGIGIENGAADNLIGGTDSGEGNTIAHNTWDGIAVGSSTGTGNTLLGNEFIDNGHLAIDLEGGTQDSYSVTDNDSGDGDSGPNNLQNYPAVSVAIAAGADIRLKGSLNSEASVQYRIEFFSTDSGTADPSGHGEGGTYLGHTYVTTNGSGVAAYDTLLSGVTVAAGDLISATATEVVNAAQIDIDDAAAYGSTSEMSQNFAATTATPSPYELWITSDNDVTSSGIVGPQDFSSGEVLRFGGPGVSMDPDGSPTNMTVGAFNSVSNLDSLVQDGDASVTAIHYVGTNITVGGGANTFDLLAGDVILSTEASETLVGTNGNLSVTNDDAFVFRPTTAGDYSSGAFYFLLDGSQMSGIGTLSSLSLVEQDTMVGDSLLTAGTFLMSEGSSVFDLRHFTATGVGAGTATQGTVTTLIDGSDVNISSFIHGVELVETSTTIGDTTLAAGTILLTHSSNDSTVGDNSISVDQQDIYYLTVTKTEWDQATTVADATLLFDGSDVNLDTTNEDVWGVALVSTTSNTPPSDIAAIATGGGGLSLNEDGGNDAYFIADDGDAILGGLTSMTTEVRFSMDSFPGTTQFLTSYDTTTQGDAVRIGIHPGGEIRLLINATRVDSTAMDYRTLADGEQHTLSVTWDSSGGLWEIFVDGALIDSGSGLQSGASISTGSGSLVYGNEQDGVDIGYDTASVLSATLYDIRIFDTVRSDAQVAANYQSTLPFDEPGMVANWTFRDLSTDGVSTESVSGNNLTLKHASGTGFVESNPTLTLAVDENALDGTVVGLVSGVDAEREALIASLLAADPDLVYSAEMGKFYKHVLSTGTWSSALTGATSSTLAGVSGQLATIQSAAENEVLFNIASGLGVNPWIGASDSDVEGEWRWFELTAAGDQFWQGKRDRSRRRLELPELELRHESARRRQLRCRLCGDPLSGWTVGQSETISIGGCLPC